MTVDFAQDVLNLLFLRVTSPSGTLLSFLSTSLVSLWRFLVHNKDHFIGDDVFSFEWLLFLCFGTVVLLVFWWWRWVTFLNGCEAYFSDVRLLSVLTECHWVVMDGVFSKVVVDSQLGQWGGFWRRWGKRSRNWRCWDCRNWHSFRKLRHLYSLKLGR